MRCFCLCNLRIFLIYLLFGLWLVEGSYLIFLNFNLLIRLKFYLGLKFIILFFVISKVMCMNSCIFKEEIKK